MFAVVLLNCSCSVDCYVVFHVLYTLSLSCCFLFGGGTWSSLFVFFVFFVVLCWCWVVVFSFVVICCSMFILCVSYVFVASCHSMCCLVFVHVFASCVVSLSWFPACCVLYASGHQILFVSCMLITHCYCGSVVLVVCGCACCGSSRRRATRS